MATIKRKTVKGVEALKDGVRIYFQINGKKSWGTIKLGRKPNAKELRHYQDYHRPALLNKIINNEFDYRTEFPDSKIPDHLKNTCSTLIKNISEDYIESVDPANGHEAIGATTFTNYKAVIRGWIYNNFGEYTIGELSTDHIKAALKRSKLKDSTITYRMNVFNEVIQYAILENMITVNPLDNLPRMKKIRHNNKQFNQRKIPNIFPFTPDEMTELLQHFKPAGRNMYQLAFWTGMRPQEFIALEWKDIDFKKRLIYVNKTINQGQEKPYGKTESATRSIIMLDAAYEALQRQKKLTFWKKSKVFLTTYDKPWYDARSVRKYVWEPAFDECNIQKRRPYNTRHTYASLMLTLGEHSSRISEQMGHNNDVTFRTKYAKVIREIEHDFGHKANEFYKTQMK